MILTINHFSGDKKPKGSHENFSFVSEVPKLKTYSK